MKTALAIFVKTPGFSPVKTRLAQTLGREAAETFYRLAVDATAAVARACAPRLAVYWAVAENDPAAWSVWSGFPVIAQGAGGLGERLHRVYAELRARHGAVLLIGADTPQLTPALLLAARAAVRDPATPFALGASADGGFWLCGGCLPLPASVWTAVRYSQADTADQLRGGLRAHGAIAELPCLRDVDDAADLPAVAQALAALSDPLPAQRRLADWLRGHDGVRRRTSQRL
ncbi:MAG: DUF2064 domain-containing protein [Nevskia sp.]|nr:DUF2064 domain-containing protein [Nevskia sp.]